MRERFLQIRHFLAFSGLEQIFLFPFGAQKPYPTANCFWGIQPQSSSNVFSFLHCIYLTLTSHAQTTSLLQKKFIYSKNIIIIKKSPLQILIKNEYLTT